MKPTLVIGASPNPERFAYKATIALTRHGHKVYPLGLRAGTIENETILTGKPECNPVHTVTLYVGPNRQPEYYDYILSLKPSRVIFNPGTENDVFISQLKSNNIEVVVDCTLVMLGSGQY